MRNIDAATLTALGQSVVRLCAFARIEFPGGTLAFNTMQRNITFDGHTYIGAGSLGKVSGLDETSDITPSQYTITLSGIPDSILNAVTTADYLNHKVVTHLAALDENHDIIGTPFVWFKGLTDGSVINSGKTSTIDVRVRDRLSDWKRPKVSRYTDAEQQRLHPGDKAMEFVTEVSSKEVNWPEASWFRSNS